MPIITWTQPVSGLAALKTTDNYYTISRNYSLVVWICQAQQAITKWLDPKAFIDGSQNVFCHVKYISHHFRAMKTPILQSINRPFLRHNGYYYYYVQTVILCRTPFMSLPFTRIYYFWIGQITVTDYPVSWIKKNRRTDSWQ